MEAVVSTPPPERPIAAPSTFAAALRPAVSIDLTAATMLEYWRARADQHIHDLYVGVPLSKFPEDLRVYEHLLWLQTPDTVIEIGTQWGGSALWFRDRLRTLRDYGRIERDPLVVTIDLRQEGARDKLPHADPRYAEQIELVAGDICDPATADAVRQLVADRPNRFVIEDSAHVYETTRGSLDAFAGLVPPGGFMVIEDGCVDIDELRVSEDWPRGVLPALRDWLATEAGREFVVRRDLELYGVSCHPHGFLQRVTSTG
jgi:cephalosporin hydroxylase